MASPSSSSLPTYYSKKTIYTVIALIPSSISKACNYITIKLPPKGNKTPS
ncbi:hypothetical protein TCARB_1856 [Thermofilum adornatum 1505]|uniref:Uncharacterized protein n=1 Tax=Thermofilum adornatum 1505 TaxID=697581 RepID=A0A3G1A7B0_9CREN|nr:hypothetical protein TCARB_1856 [Thermofilum adornatum 1505]